MKYFCHKTAIIETKDIGEGTKVWAFSHLSKGCKIGKNCIIGEGVHIGTNVIIGDNVKIQNHSLIYEGVTIEDDVFIGPNVVTTNDFFPKTGHWDTLSLRFRKTLLKKGCSVGANSTIICGVTLEESCLVGAGSVVTKNVKEKTLVFGNPAKFSKNLNS
jgi:UDP-2-acetamido-3-amino-2,3-dideoxy-glucuronate N-acetyltransferase